MRKHYEVRAEAIGAQKRATKLWATHEQPKAVRVGIARDNTARRKEQCQAFVGWLKEGLDCTDCGQKLHPIIMEFDHLPEFTKFASIATLAGKGQRSRLLDELPKTQLVCRVCHHVRSRSRYVSKAPSSPQN
jgi:hypothetical protein